MRKGLLAGVVSLVVFWIASAVAQSPGPFNVEMKPIAATTGLGVSNATLLDRPDVRVLRVDVEPGGVRNVHTHDDTHYHLFIPTAAGIEMEVEPAKPVALAAWQAQYITGGVRHGFKNTARSSVTVLEVFAKK